MKKILLVSLLSLSLFGLTIGDKLDGKTIKTLKLKSNIIYVVDIFASWCHSCKKELPLVSKLNNTINKTKYEIIGIDIDEDKKIGINFQQQVAVNFRVINDDKNVIVKTFAPVGIPALYIIKNGLIIDEIIGAVDKIDTVINKKLAKIK
ncbi:MAG: TlpA family protein disulfide reductase [Epsilonproteobacteria bacterium]|nr:MAG: TlpA family protein disulfide reductase [Campylobacterota bacterium]